MISVQDPEQDLYFSFYGADTMAELIWLLSFQPAHITQKTSLVKAEVFISSGCLAASSSNTVCQLKL